jgi:predicted DNA-binding transcriptional regulator YafY
MNKIYTKKDRTARLLKEQIILWQYPQGLKIEELAEKCSISKKTAYRDLKALESELNIPIWEEGSKRGIEEGYFLPPINFTLTEAMSIFVAARLIQSFSDVRNPDIISTFMKLATVIPPPLRKHLQNTIEYFEKQQIDTRMINNFHKLTEGWLSQHQVKILYKGVNDEKPFERIIEPYFIEPSALFHANYVLAYCNFKKMICSINLNLIVGDVEILPDTFDIPSTFNLINYLGDIMSISSENKLINVKLRFKPNASKIIFNRRWYPSQKNRMCSDGTAIITIRTGNSLALHTWILGFGDDIEVISPKVLRNQIIGILQAMSNSYRINDIAGKPVSTRINELSSIMAKPIEVTNAQWRLIKPLLPAQAWTGRPRIDDRKIINGILCVLRSNIRWNKIPPKYGVSSTCFARLQKWKQLGIWDRIWDTLSTH